MFKLTSLLLFAILSFLQGCHSKDCGDRTVWFFNELKKIEINERQYCNQEAIDILALEYNVSNRILTEKFNLSFGMIIQDDENLLERQAPIKRYSMCVPKMPIYQRFEFIMQKIGGKVLYENGNIICQLGAKE